MSDDTPDSLIPYDSIVQEALRAVVGRVLGEIEQGGSELPGAHHFYITFKTHAPGVSIPAALRERFPDEMTIVLQNKFWNLNVREDGFAVGLSFNQVPAELDIPYAAITQFVDPAAPAGPQLLLLAVTFVTVSTLSDGAFGLAAGKLAPYLKGEHAQMLRNKITGTVLVAAGIGLALSRR